MKSERQMTTRHMTVRYLIALTLLAGLALAVYLFLREEIRAASRAPALVELSGRQQHLLQLSALQAQEFVSARDDAKRNAVKRELLQTVEALESTHYQLIEFDWSRSRSAKTEEEAPTLFEPPKPEEVKTLARVKQVYFEAPWLLDLEIRNYIAQVKSLVDSPPADLTHRNPHLGFIREIALSDRVKDALDEVVSAYQQQIEVRTAKLRRIAYLSFVATFAVLGLMGMFVFRPMVSRVRHDMTTLQDLNDTLEERVADRTALADSRTRELERSETAMRQQSRILRSILDSMGDGVVVLNRDRSFELFNPAAKQLLNIHDDEPTVGLNRENWLKRHGIALFSPDETTPYPWDRLPIFRAIDGESVNRSEVLLRRHADESETWLSVTARPIPGDDHTVFGGVAVLRDITERKRAEQELRNSEALYHSLVDNLPLCVLRKDLEGRFVFANDRFCQLLGTTPTAVQGKTDSDFYPPELTERYRQNDRQVIESETAFEEIEDLFTPDGTQRFVEVRKTPVHDSDGSVVGTQSIFWDVTSRILAQREREAMHARLVQSERLAAIGQMVAGVAHESRNALQQIHACTQLLGWRMNGERDDDLRGLIADIDQAQDRLRRLFDDLRGYASPLKMERRRCNLKTVVESAWDEVANTEEGRMARLGSDVRADDLCCEVDSYQLEQVFRNLFENSVAASETPADIRICYHNARVGEVPALQLTVRDNGPGFTAEALERVFEPFFTTKSQGTGLGMAIAKRIVEAHGGRIEVRNSVGCGAEFLITLPRREA